MLSTKKIVPILVLALAAAGCGDSSESPTEPETKPSIAGSWSGSSQGVSLQLVVQQSESGALSGSGTLSSGSEFLALTVTSGAYSHPNVSMTLQNEQFEEMNYTGSASGTTIAGSLNGSGFSNFTLNLNRQ